MRFTRLFPCLSAHPTQARSHGGTEVPARPLPRGGCGSECIQQRASEQHGARGTGAWTDGRSEGQVRRREEINRRAVCLCAQPMDTEDSVVRNWGVGGD